jgi:hypothetical protein
MMAEVWQVRLTTEWYLSQVDRYEYMGDYEGISVSLEMAQKTLESAMNDPEKDSRFDEIYRRLQLSIDQKREFYKDVIEEFSQKGS